MPTEIHIFSQNHPRRSARRSSISNKTTITKRSRKIKKRIRKCITKYPTTNEDRTRPAAQLSSAESDDSRRTTERDDTTVATELIADLIEDLELPRRNNKTNKTKKPDNKNDGDTIVIVSTLVVQTVKRTAHHAYRALSY